MYAVVRTGGKQYKVAKDTVLKVETLSGDVGSKLDLEVLMLGGDSPKIGAPLVAGAYVQCEIVEHGPTEEIMTRPQHPYTRRLIDSIPRSASQSASA